MKHILKVKEPPEPPMLRTWKEQENEDWKPTWDNFGGEPKRTTHVALLKEQGYICCYCMQRIEKKSSHIEHVIPRSVSGTNEAQKLDYSNMIASCQGEYKKKNSTEPIEQNANENNEEVNCNSDEKLIQQHCGHYRENWYDPTQYISPLNPDCELRFIYNDEGKIMPAPDDRGAEETIKMLRLDYTLLEKNRKQAIRGVIPDELTIDDLRLLLQRYGERDAEGKFREYCGAIQQVIRQQI